jgi:lysophospholipase L1-like esterase
MRRVLAVVIPLLSIVFALGVCELGLRLGGYQYSPLQLGQNVKDDWRDDHAFFDRHLVYDPVLIWRPHSTPFSRFNPQGFRGALLDVPKPTGKFRIFTLGDSNTFGWSVDEGANWSTQLHNLLAASRPNIEVINAGVTGYTSFQGLRRFQELLQYQPDMVLVSFGANDAHQVTVPDAQYVARHERMQYLSRATKQLRLAQLGVQSWDGIATLAGAGGKLGPRVSVDDYRSHLREIIRVGRERGIQTVLLTRPFVGAETNPGSWKTYAPAYNAATIELGREEQVPVIDIYTAFRDREKLFDDESHFGVEGHRVAAGLIHDHIAPLLNHR